VSKVAAKHSSHHSKGKHGNKYGRRSVLGKSDGGVDDDRERYDDGGIV
jgi:hypothetical protein